MAEKRKLEYFLLRYVGNVVRQEFVNIGLVMTESGGDGGGFAGAHFTGDWRRARSLDPNVDTEVLEALGREVQQRLGNVDQRAQVLHQMMDSYSNAVQISPIWRCSAEDPEKELRQLASSLVEAPVLWSGEGPELTARMSGRRWLRAQMSAAFRSAGVWDLMSKDLPASPYTNETDDFTFDFGYAVGNSIRLFHAVSLVDVGQESRMFPLRVAKIRPKMMEMRKARPLFTAIVEDRYEEQDRAVRTVLAFMKDEEIRVARVREMGEIAQIARSELGA
jgi:Protein of unknown function (DUF3037)